MSTTEVISALQQAFPSDRLALPGKIEYTISNDAYLSGLERDLSPACIFLPATKEEVAAFVHLIRPFIFDENAKFAIRGSGQQPAPGCANIENGITLDLSRLKGVEVKEGIVSIATGEQWGNVYEALLARGLAAAGNRSTTGGIGGLATSGGLSFFSSREGFVCDNVVNYEVVLASGSIVNASATENNDLWLALRGGGNNFGIVTRFDLRTFKQGQFWGGSVYYFPPSFGSQIDALVDELQKPDASLETHLMASIGYAAQFGQTMCMNQLYFTQAVEDPEVLHPFTKVQPQIDAMNTMRMVNLVEAASEQKSDSPEPQRCSYMNCVVKADKATLAAASELYTTALEPIKPVEGLICSFTLQPYAASLLQKSRQSGGNSLGLDVGDGPMVSVLLLTYWKHKADDEQVLNVMKSTLAEIEKDADRRGTLVPYKFMNYAFNHQDVIGSYGPENKAKLQNVSKKYDPNGMFQIGVPGGWKLFP